MTLIEDKIEPPRILLRAGDNTVAFDSDRPNLAVLAHFFGDWTSPVRSGPNNVPDSVHIEDHDVGAAPLGAQYIFGSIRLDGADYWHEFSGARELGAISWWSGSNAHPRIFTVYHELAPVIASGRVALRERWWVHGAGPAQYTGWPNGVQILARKWHYDLRVCAFVGGI